MNLLDPARQMLCNSAADRGNYRRYQGGQYPDYARHDLTRAGECRHRRRCCTAAFDKSGKQFGQRRDCIFQVIPCIFQCIDDRLERFLHKGRNFLCLFPPFPEFFLEVLDLRLNLLEFLPCDVYPLRKLLHGRNYEILHDRLADFRLELLPFFRQIGLHVGALRGFLCRLSDSTGSLHHVFCIFQTCCLLCGFVQIRPCLGIRDYALFNSICRHLCVVGKQSDGFTALIGAVDETVQVPHGFFQ